MLLRQSNNQNNNNEKFDDMRCAALTIEAIDLTGFDGLEAEWNELLANSNADPLVMSWKWQRIWWRTFGEQSDKQLKLLCARNLSGELVGVAPLYIERCRRFGIRFNRLQFLANQWRAEDNIRSEYVDFVLHAEHTQLALESFFLHIENNLEWDEFVVANHWQASESAHFMYEWCERNGHFVRLHERGTTYRCDLQGSIEDFKAGLAAKTRRQLFNQRKQLNQHKNVTLEVATANTVQGMFESLDRFHRRRWGIPAFAGRRRQFHDEVARRYAADDELELTAICVDDRPVSVLYDFAVGSVKYGYKMAFDGDFDNRLSLSKLHIGYSIESAYERGLAAFDFLRGSGRGGSPYKSKIAHPYRETVTTQVVKPRLMQLVYRSFEANRAGVRSLYRRFGNSE